MSAKKNDIEGMHPEDIKAAIRKKGKTLGQLSLEWGFCESAVRTALRRELPAVEAHIAKYIGKPLHVIWPDRYTPESIRKSHLSNTKKPNAKKSRRHCKK